MQDKIRSFKDLKVWQKSIELVKEIYHITKIFPKEENYGLSAQMRRTVISIPSNIAEGFRRRFIKEHKQFINIALGSCAELETHIIIAKELGYINSSTEQKLREELNYICAMLVNINKKI
jgi:four helix bundle protein